jgi:trimeric autotransporter adhesin
VLCDIGGLAEGGSTSVVFVVNQMSAGSSAMTVQVSGSEADPNLNNNQATATAAIAGSTYNLPPAILSVTPAAIQSGSSDTAITVAGSNFASGSSIVLDGVALPTTFVSATQLTATVPAAKLANLGWSSVSVTTPAPGGGTSSSLPLSIYSVITLGVNHILYDPYSRNIMASVGSGSSQITGNSIAAITPNTLTVGSPVSIGSQPENLALTSDGQVLYVVLVGSESVARYDMLAQAAEYTYSVPTSPDGTIALRGVATQPGTENTVALDLGSWVGNAVYDFNPTNQTAAIRGQASGPYTGSCLQFLDASDMLSFDIDTSGSTFDHYTVTSAGFTYYDYSQYTESTLNGFGGGCFKLGGGLAFGADGGVANPLPATATQLGTFAVPAGSSQSFSSVAPDASLQTAFFVNTTGVGYSTVSGITSYNVNTYLPIAELPLNLQTTEGTNSDYGVVDFIRWGQDGLAMLTTSGHIYLLRGPVVVPQLLNTNTAAVLTTSSASSLTHGSGNVLLTLTGSNFVPGVAVTWNGSYRTTTIVDAAHVTVAIPASDLASTGTGTLVAINPGAPASSPLQVSIN